MRQCQGCTTLLPFHASSKQRWCSRRCYSKRYYYEKQKANPLYLAQHRRSALAYQQRHYEQGLCRKCTQPALRFQIWQGATMIEQGMMVLCATCRDKMRMT